MSAEGLRYDLDAVDQFRRDTVDGKDAVVATARHLLPVYLDLRVDRWQPRNCMKSYSSRSLEKLTPARASMRRRGNRLETLKVFEIIGKDRRRALGAIARDDGSVDDQFVGGLEASALR